MARNAKCFYGATKHPGTGIWNAGALKSSLERLLITAKSKARFREQTGKTFARCEVFPFWPL
jgi:hypothetical protein